MRILHWPAVIAIERQSFEFAPFGLNCLNDHFDADRIEDAQEQGMGEVATVWGKPVGHMLYTLQVRAIFLDSIAVDPDFRCQGIAHEMLHWLKRLCRQQRFGKLHAVVRESNLHALGWLSRRGFIAATLLRQPWQDLGCGDDGIEMVWRVKWKG